MGALDQAQFERLVTAGCPSCHGRVLEISSVIDRSLVMMAGDPNDAGRWVHDGEKFVDGTYRVECVACRAVLFESALCPRCNADGALPRVLGQGSRLVVPKRCPSCNELELLALAMVPASARHGGGERPKPTPRAEFGEPGYHVVAFACPGCDKAVVAERCPLCDAAGPLRARP